MKIPVNNRVVDPYDLAHKANPCDILLKAYKITGIIPEQIIRTALHGRIELNYIDEYCYFFSLGKGTNKIVKEFTIYLIREWLKEHPEQLDDSEVK